MKTLIGVAGVVLGAMAGTIATYRHRLYDLGFRALSRVAQAREIVG